MATVLQISRVDCSQGHIRIQWRIPSESRIWDDTIAKVNSGKYADVQDANDALTRFVATAQKTYPDLIVEYVDNAKRDHDSFSFPETPEDFEQAYGRRV